MIGLSKIGTAAEAAMSVKDGATIGISIRGLAGWPQKMIRAIGSGSFFNFSRNAKKVVFCGDFTAGAFKIAVENGNPTILQESKLELSVDLVDQITYSSKYAKSIAAGGPGYRKGCFFLSELERPALIEILRH
jgi:acyl CoA:acetate/3-ketoacid CoA transferase